MATMQDSSASASYDRFYYANYCGDRPYRRDEKWMGFFGSIAEQIVQRIGPATALDAGCAFGMLVEALRDQGVDASGVDISEYAISQVREDVRPYCWAGSVTKPFPRRYDMIVSIEVLEHLTPAEGERAIANFCRHTDDVVFSSTPDDYREATHLNVQPAEYWAELFARQGFFRDVEFDATFIAPWAVRYRRGEGPVSRVVAAYERRLSRLERQIQAQRQLGIDQRNQLAAKDAELNSLRAALEAAKMTHEPAAASAPDQRPVEALSAGLADVAASLRELKARVETGHGELRAAVTAVADAIAYQQLVQRVREEVAALPPADGAVLVVSKGDPELLRGGGRAAWHFPEDGREGYAGHNPAEAAEAINELERLRARGARFLVFPQTAFWWLEHYSEFARYLQDRYRRVRDTESCIIFDLAGPGPEAASHMKGGG